MTSVTSKVSNEDYLDMFKISDGKYLIGIYQDGITVYKQQIRALNIFQALVVQGIIKPHETFRVGIIGGGVAGLTFAAAALKANLMVRIFEREANYLHMQYGCDTRKIHPHIYEWPDKGSLNPDAGLPVLNWRYDTASNVCKQIINGFNEVKGDMQYAKEYRAKDYIEEYKKSIITSISPAPTDSDYKFKIHFEYDRKSLTCQCDLIIYAVGYGFEVDKNSKTQTPSYWRNDALAQTFLKQNSDQFLISGLGDGGLIDLFRLKIEDFDYDFIIDIITSKDSFKNLSDKLLSIKHKGLSEQKKVALSFYYEEFDNIPVHDYEYILEELRSRKKIRDTKIILNASVDFSSSLDFNKVSLLNAFLTYVLYKEKYFTYLKGRLEYDKVKKNHQVTDSKVTPPLITSIKKAVNLVARHGTNTEGLLDGKILSQNEINHLTYLETKQKESFNFGKIEKRWTDTELNSIFSEKSYRELKIFAVEGTTGPNHEDAVTSIQTIHQTAYVTPDSISMFSGYLSVLSEVLKSLKPESHFRLAMHRVTEINDESIYQQITYYFGTGEHNENAGDKRIFPAKRGNVGVSIATGLPILLVNKDENDFKKLIESLNLQSSAAARAKKSFLTIPVQSALPSVGDNKKRFGTNIVLYADSDEADFFSKDILQLLFNSIRGMIKAIEQQLQQKYIYMTNLEYVPMAVSPSKIPKSVKSNSCFIPWESLGIELENANFLKFDQFYTFDIINNTNYSQLRNIR